jgi:hypothetical protein
MILYSLDDGATWTRAPRIKVRYDFNDAGAREDGDSTHQDVILQFAFLSHGLSTEIISDRDINRKEGVIYPEIVRNLRDG